MVKENVLKSIVTELNVPNSDDSLRQATSVKEYMGPVTSFWFDRILPALSEEDAKVVLPFAKKECEAAVHKDDNKNLFAVFCFENKLQPRDAARLFPLPKEIRDRILKIKPTRSKLTGLRAGRWAKRALLPLLKDWKRVDSNRIISELEQVHERIEIDVPDPKSFIDPIYEDESLEEDELVGSQFRFVAGTFVKSEGSYVLISGDPESVAKCYKYPKSVTQALKRPVGMFSEFLNEAYVLIRNDEPDWDKVKALEEAGLVKVEKVTEDEIDPLSFSSVNRPVSLVVKKPKELRKAVLEYFINPFAHYTELKRGSHFALWKHPKIKTEPYTRLKFKLFEDEFEELPLVQGITLFFENDSPDVEEFLLELTGLPVSLAGDGYVVSTEFLRKLGLSERDVVKLQGPGRAKGISVAKFDRLEIDFHGSFIDVEVIQNIQGKRKNKLANVYAACLRFLKWRGVPVPVIDAHGEIDLKLVEKVLDACAVTVKFGSKEVTGLIGVQKFFIDPAPQYSAKLDSVAVDYPQAVLVEELLGLRKDIERLPKRETDLEVAYRAKRWMDFCYDTIRDIDNVDGLGVKVPKGIRKDAVLATTVGITRDFVEAIYESDFTTLSALVNHELMIPSLDGTVKLKPLQPLYASNGSIGLSEFAIALRSYLEALVDYVSNPTEASKKWLALQIAKLYKSCAKHFTRGLTAPRGFAISGRHATSSRSDNVVLVPRKLYWAVLNNAKASGQVQRNEWVLVRHPIVGAMPIVKVEPADVEVILVPKHLAKEIDGDDDGDIVFVFPI